MIKIWDIPSKIESLHLTHDGDETDTRLHVDDMIRWYTKAESLYESIEQNIRDFEVKGKGYTVYAGYDASGYDYWIIRQGEGNYIDVTISFEGSDFDEEGLEQLEKDILKVYQHFKVFESHCFDPYAP